jgi:hypothetical protein
MHRALPNKRSGSSWLSLTRCFVALLCVLIVGFTASKARAEESPFEPSFSFGLAGQLESLQWPSVSNPESPTIFGGIQTLYRMTPHFASGGSLLFEPTRSEIIVQLNTRWIWPLYVAEPYLGAQLEYLSRTDGGFSLAFRPGVLVPLPFLPASLDFYTLGRYDVVGILLNGRDPLGAAHFALGAALLFQF